MATAKAQQTLPTETPPNEPPPGEIVPTDKKKLSAKQIATNAATLQAFLVQNERELESFARGFMKPEHLTRMAMIALTKSPMIAKCTLGSILRALMDATALRIRPGGLNGRGYLVPRKNNKVNPPVYECHFDPGWRGLVDVARRSRQLKSIGAQVVRVGDEFDYGYHPLPKLHWRPLRDAALEEEGEAAAGTEKRRIIAAFAVAELGDGAVQIEVVEGEDLEKIKAVSEAAKANSGPWIDWEAEMCRKTAVKRLCKYLPVPDDFDELDNAMALSDGADIGSRLSVLDTEGEEVPQEPTQAEGIRSQLNAPGMSAADQLSALEREAAELSASR